MNSSRLPLSLVVLLATTTTNVCAQSALDPYEHIKAPASKKTPVAAANEPALEAPTYVMTPVGESAEGGEAKKSKFGFMPKVKMPNMGGIGDKFKSASAAVADKTKDMGSGIANGAKASGGLMKKPFSKGDKTKVAKKEDWSTKGSKSAGRSASLEGLYVNDAQKQFAAHEQHKPKPEHTKLAKKEDESKDKDKDKSLTQAALAPVKGAGAATKKLFSPLAKLKKTGTPAAEERPASGFLEGALAKQDQQVQEKAKVAEKTAENATPKKAEGATGTPAELAGAAPAKKKSKYGMGMLTKMKAPSIPFMGKKDGTKVAKRAQVLDPQADAAAPAGSALDPTAQAAKPAAPSTTPVTTPIAPELTQVAAGKPAKAAGQGKMAGMKSAMSGSLSAMGGGISKINPFKKKSIAEPPKQSAAAPEAKPAL